MKQGYFSFQVVFILHITIVMSRHNHHHHHHQTQSELCQKCPPGFGVVSRCTKHRDTECSPCQPGYYSSHNSAHRPCYPCSRCGVGLYVAHKCTPLRDTVCDSCHTYKGPHNENFYQKCVLPLLTKGKDGAISQEVDGRSSTSVVKTSSTLSSNAVLLGVIAASALTGAFLFTLAIIIKKRYCSKVTFRYPYQAVATQEAVML